MTSLILIHLSPFSLLSLLSSHLSFFHFSPFCSVPNYQGATVTATVVAMVTRSLTYFGSVRSSLPWISALSQKVKYTLNLCEMLHWTFQTRSRRRAKQWLMEKKKDGEELQFSIFLQGQIEPVIQSWKCGLPSKHLHYFTVLHLAQPR